MPDSRFSDMMKLIGFDARDAALLGQQADTIEPWIPSIVDHFYEALLQRPDARAIFTGGEPQIERLRHLLADWLRGLFSGTYDSAYYEKRLAIGAAHVRVALPQQYMILGIELIRQELETALRSADVAETDLTLRSLDKLLTLELAIMLESYKEGFAKRIRRSERDALEEKLTRAEHLAEIGQLAASLAHEIKNPLAGISGAIEVIGDGMPAGNPHRQIVKEILGQISRLDAAVKDLLVYARPVKPRAAQIVLHDAVVRVLMLLREEPEIQRVRVDYEPPAGDSTVHADDSHMEQLLMNLIINAAHASQDGQVIKVEVIPNGESVRLAVTDWGAGMPPHVRERAFEAFFTTKAKGTGLGLAICRRLVEATDGTIELQSELGEGTKVMASLPRTGPTEDKRTQR